MTTKTKLTNEERERLILTDPQFVCGPVLRPGARLGVDVVSTRYPEFAVIEWDGRRRCAVDKRVWRDKLGVSLNLHQYASVTTSTAVGFNPRWAALALVAAAVTAGKMQGGCELREAAKYGMVAAFQADEAIRGYFA